MRFRADRTAIVEILRGTQSTLPAYFQAVTRSPFSPCRCSEPWLLQDVALELHLRYETSEDAELRIGHDHFWSRARD